MSRRPERRFPRHPTDKPRHERNDHKAASDTVRFRSPLIGRQFKRINVDSPAIEASEEHEHNHQQAKISDCEVVASYNWKDGEQPSILVPGRHDSDPR